MKLAFSKPTASLTDERLLLGEFSRVGYDGLQLKSGQYVPYLDRPMEWLDQYGGYPGAASAVVVGGLLDEAGTDFLRRVIKFGKAVKTELIVFCHGASRQGLTKEHLARYAVALSEVGREAEYQGLKLSLHNHFGQPVMLADDLRTFFDAAAGVGLTIDTAHLVKSGVEDIAGVIREFGPYIDNFHLKDFADGDFKVLGRGRIDFAPVFEAIRAVGYDGWISADEESGADLLLAMSECLHYMKTRL